MLHLSVEGDKHTANFGCSRVFNLRLYAALCMPERLTALDYLIQLSLIIFKDGHQGWSGGHKQE